MRQPWQDDPYDLLVSLDFVVLPLLVATGVLRFQLCRRYSVLPARRLVDLLRICGAAVGACLVTELGEWIAVALGLHRAAWDAATFWQVVALMASTVAMVGVGLLLRSATHAVDRVARPAAQPDWLADAVTLGLRASGVLRQGTAGALRCAGLTLIWSRASGAIPPSPRPCLPACSRCPTWRRRSCSRAIHGRSCSSPSRSPPERSLRSSCSWGATCALSRRAWTRARPGYRRPWWRAALEPWASPCTTRFSHATKPLQN